MSITLSPLPPSKRQRRDSQNEVVGTQPDSSVPYTERSNFLTEEIDVCSSIEMMRLFRQVDAQVWINNKEKNNK